MGQSRFDHGAVTWKFVHTNAGSAGQVIASIARRRDSVDGVCTRNVGSVGQLGASCKKKKIEMLREQLLTLHTRKTVTGLDSNQTQDRVPPSH
jgi:hypothetical protein